MSSRSAWPTGGRISKEKRTKHKVSKDKKKTSQGSSSNQQVEPERSPVKFPRVEDFHLLPRLAFPSEFGRHLPHGRGGGGVLRLGLSDITTFAPPRPASWYGPSGGRRSPPPRFLLRLVQPPSTQGWCLAGARPTLGFGEAALSLSALPRQLQLPQLPQGAQTLVYAPALTPLERCRPRPGGAS